MTIANHESYRRLLLERIAKGMTTQQDAIDLIRDLDEMAELLREVYPLIDSGPLKARVRRAMT